MSQTLPNILMVVVDCARSDKWIGPGRHCRTPVVDRLCRDGITLPTTITEKSCTTPCFTSMLTGLYSPRHGVHMVWGYRVAEQLPMLTHGLAEHGYHTYAEVTGPLLPEMGLERGFESYEYRVPNDGLHTCWGDRLVDRLRTGHYRSPWFLLLHAFEVHDPRRIAPEHNCPASGRDGYERAASSLDAQLERIFAAAGDDAFIVLTGDHGEKTDQEHYAPDSAVPYARKLLGVDEAEGMPLYNIAWWTGPSVLQQLYGQFMPMVKDVRLRDAWQRPTFSRWARLRDRLRLLLLTPRVYVQDLLALGSPMKMTAMLKRRGLLDVDRSRRKVERFARSLGRDKLFDMQMRMWINSYKNNEREGHGIHVYDYLVRVPLVMRWRGRLPAGAVLERMVRQPDILPTILDLVGVDPMRFDGIDGRTLRPLIEGRAWTPAPAYVSVSGVPIDIELRGVRTEEYKYTFGPHNPEMPQELYDLRSDPGEARNLAAAQPERCEELRTLAERFIPHDGPTESIPVAVDAGQQQRIEQRLRELGYID